jgi:hypothetical protein
MAKMPATAACRSIGSSPRGRIMVLFVVAAIFDFHIPPL